jgi:L-threonylcarbamoyladenylate synthase
MQVFSCSDAEKCASIVKHGGVVVFPTDTIYGIGCDPYNDAAVKRIFRIKGRDEKKPLPVLAYSAQDAEKLIALGRTGMVLAKKYWPGALTIVAPITDNNRISPIVTAGSMNLAARVPANRCVLLLLKHCKYLVGTSANLSGQKSSKSVKEVLGSGLAGFDALLDGGAVEKGVESTIVDVAGATPKVVREGAIKAEEIYRSLET